MILPWPQYNTMYMLTSGALIYVIGRIQIQLPSLMTSTLHQSPYNIPRNDCLFFQRINIAMHIHVWCLVRQ